MSRGFAILLGAFVMVLGTWLGYPVWAPVAGGLVVGWVAQRRPASTAALAGLVAWGGLLATAMLRGQPVGRAGSLLAGAMELPTWVPLVLTLGFPALLAASAAWLVSRVRRGDAKPAASSPRVA